MEWNMNLNSSFLIDTRNFHWKHYFWSVCVTSVIYKNIKGELNISTKFYKWDLIFVMTQVNTNKIPQMPDIHISCDLDQLISSNPVYFIFLVVRNAWQPLLAKRNSYRDCESSN